jgi:hypothetical protein
MPLARTPRLGISYAEAVGFLLGGTSITVVGTAKQASISLLDVYASASLSKKVALTFGGIALTAAGVALGYYFGFDDRVRCGDPLFRQLLDDPTFWRGVEQDFFDDHHWMITYSDQISPDPVVLSREDRQFEKAKWAAILGRFGLESSLRDDLDDVGHGVRFMRILPYRDQKVNRLDFLSEGRLAGVLDWAHPLTGKAGTWLSRLNMNMRRSDYCNPCLPESIAQITDGLPIDIDKDLLHLADPR